MPQSLFSPSGPSARRLRTGAWGLLVAGALAIGIAVGAWLPSDDDFFELRKNFRIFGAAYEELVTGYVEPLDPARLMRVGLDAMLDELDPYTTFIDEGATTDRRIRQQGRYGGVGLNVARRAGRITVIAPVEGASGYKQGLRAGDVLTRVAGQPTEGLSVRDVQTLLHGEPGSTVTVAVRRQGASGPLTFTLTRERPEARDVTYHGFVGPAAAGVGYVKLERFTRKAGPEVRRAIEALAEERALNGLVLDLRDNPGGLLGAAVDVAELFVPRGATVVSTRGRLEETQNTYRSSRDPLLPDVRLVLLVNDLSASASEIVAGAVQDLDRGVVLGTATYGKGLVQVVRSLPYNTALKMTTAEYYTPSGRSIQSVDPAADTAAAADTTRRSFETAAGRTVRDRQGIRPDVRVPEAPAGELEEALTRRAAFFRYANHYAAGRDTLPDGFAATDAVLADFRSWLGAEKIAYPTDAERSVRRLRRRLANDGYDGVGDEVEALQEALEAAKAAGFDRSADALKRHLEREILARFVPRSRQVEAALADDRQVTEAVALLRNGDRYTGILTPDAE